MDTRGESVIMYSLLISFTNTQIITLLNRMLYLLFRRSHSLHVKATTSIPGTQGHSLNQILVESIPYVRIKKTNTPFRIIGQEGTQEISFIPVPSTRKPVAFVVKGIEDVVEMYNYPISQSRDNLKEKKRKVTSCLYYMA